VSQKVDWVTDSAVKTGLGWGPQENKTNPKKNKKKKKKKKKKKSSKPQSSKYSRGKVNFETKPPKTPGGGFRLSEGSHDIISG